MSTYKKVILIALGVALSHALSEVEPEIQEEDLYTCDSSVCNPDDDYYNYFNRKSFAPVCGVKDNCLSGNCRKTFTNVCSSCSKTSARTYPFYEEGPCETDKVYCSAKRPTNCASTTNSQVCAALPNENGNTVYTTVSNPCNACKDPTVSYYVKGGCGTPVDDKTYCLPNNRRTQCSTTSAPVCGFYKDPKNRYNILHRVVLNLCNACKDPSIIYTTPGPCVFKCDRDPNVIYECSSSLTPMCGTYKENGVTKKASFKNSCLGCHQSSMNIESYTEGLCSGDNGILCKNDGSGIGETDYAPVCGLTTLNCNSKSCRKTYDNSLDACQASKVVKYLPGPCPGDRVTCSYLVDYGSNNSDLGDVCAYKRSGCTSSSCRSNIKNGVNPCEDKKVLYFVGGKC